jgi:1-acyl-sn-glycerol-3-phosphate acyltransferase/DNA-directed RNA polymerase subunit RPC12/RpoP
LREVKRFDLAKTPRPVSWYLRPVIWLLVFPLVWYNRTKILKKGMEKTRSPYLLLCNHNAFYDFFVATAATFPHQAFYVVAIDGFIGLEWLMRRVGCVGKRKFTNDVRLIRHLKTVADRGKIVAVYPEARYSLCGTKAVLPPSLGKLVKHLNVPVVTLITYGHHINSPFWNTRSRGVRTRAVMTEILTQQQSEEMTAEQINTIINDSFEYDDFAWQRENKIRVRYRNRARGLHKVLYQCPSCRTEYRMDSGGTQIWCNHCGKRWTMSEYGALQAAEGETHFSHIPDWYEWERLQVRAEVEAGAYSLTKKADLRLLPNSRGFVDYGDTTFIHDMDGFRLEGVHNGEPYNLFMPAQSLYSCHIEYEYGKYKRDCVDLNTLNDSFWVFPRGDDFSVTKISLATEELFNYKNP